MKKFIPSLFCLFLLSLTGCGVIDRVVEGTVVPTRVTIEGVTYRSEFYGELYPLFGEAGDKGSETLQKEIIYDDGTRKFQRVDFKGHDWVHSYIGKYTGGIVYCAENEWEKMRDYYANHYISEKAEKIPEIDLQKFDELLAFGKENDYKPFAQRSNDKAMQKAHRLPETEFHGGVCFYKVSKDGYFTTFKSPMYFKHDGKLLLVLFHDGGRTNGGVEEVVYIDVPDELGKYFLDLMEQYQQ